MKTERAKSYRYPGVKPFSEEEQHLFFGRSNDTKKLFQLINLEKMVLLYSKSGLGKSSLLNAGVLPLYEADERFSIIKIRLGAYTELSETPVTTALLKMPVVQQNHIIQKLEAESDSLWLHIKNLQYQEANLKKTYILVFDQFEELFTYSSDQVNEFKRQLADLLYANVPAYINQSITNRLKQEDVFLTDEEFEYLYRKPNIKVVFSIRSDRMSLLNGLTDYLPHILKNFYELKPLDRSSATEAIVKPAADEKGNYLSAPFHYPAETCNLILDHLTQNSNRNIETFQLQTVCHFAENLAIAGKLYLDEQRQRYELLPEMLGDLQNIFRTHYDTVISKIETTDTQLAARLLLENLLIIDGHRISLPEAVLLREKGVDKKLLSYLHDEQHILRSEPNTTGGINYELSHDTLVAPILKAKQEREEQEALTLKEVERQEELKIENEKNEKERIERERKRKRRTITIVSISAIIFVCFSVFAWNQKMHSDDLAQKVEAYEKEAEIEQKKVIKRHNDLDSMVTALGFMDQDTTMVKALNELSFKYYRYGYYDLSLLQAKKAIALSQEIKYRKGEARALSTIGSNYYGKGDLPEGLKNHLEALKIREELGDNREIADSYNNLGLIYLAQNDSSNAMINFKAALERFTQVGSKEGVANAYTNIGMVYMNQPNLKQAIENHLKALKIFQETQDEGGIILSYNNLGYVYENWDSLPRALDYYNLALAAFIKLQTERPQLAPYNNLGFLYSKMGKPKEAKYWLLKGLELAKNTKSIIALQDSYEGLVQVDTGAGDFKSAFEHHTKFIIYRDSLNNR